MRKLFQSTALALTAFAMLATAAWAAPPVTSTTKPAAGKPALNHAGNAKNNQHEKMTFQIRGAVSAADTKAITEALKQHHVMASVLEIKGNDCRMAATARHSTDLSACCNAVMAIKPSKKSSVTSSMDLVLFSKLDKASAKKATDALAKIVGVDAKMSKVDEAKGELWIRIRGDQKSSDQKLTADSILRDLKVAGIEAELTNPKIAKKL